ncbi:MAG: porin [Candidatus Dadabacteria bacterium]|nr:porin [Candidatus Dadabacteria bacterium]
MKVLQKITAAFVVIALGVAAFAPQSHAEVDYKKALVYTSPDGRFQIKQNFRIQFRADFTDSNEADSDLETDFMIRRLKMKFGGHAYEKWLKYGFQLAGNAGRDDRPREDDIKIEDAFIVIAKSKAADFKAGRYKIPYEREILNSSSALQFVDRSIAKEAVIGGDRADGFSVGGILGNLIAYRMGLFQFDGDPFSGGDNILLAGRLQANVCCGELKYSSGSFTAGGDYKVTPNFAKVPTFSIGLGGFSHTGEDSRNGFTADLVAKVERANFEASVNYGSLEDGSEDYNRLSYRLQAGAMLTSDLEAAIRWAGISNDTGGGNDEREITFGLNYYLAAGHRAKVQVDYSNINEKDGISAGKDKKENRVRAQIQVSL